MGEGLGPRQFNSKSKRKRTGLKQRESAVGRSKA